MSDTLSRVQRLVIENIHGVDPEKVTAEARLIDDLNADSFDTIELTIAVEDEFKIDVTDAEAEAMKTVGDVVTLVSTKLAVAA